MNDLLIVIFAFALGFRSRELYQHLRSGANRSNIVHRVK